MKVLLGIPHIFDPKASPTYSSQAEEKRALKTEALKAATEGNWNRLERHHWIHASVNEQVVIRALKTTMGIDLTIQVFTDPGASLADQISSCKGVTLIKKALKDRTRLPELASRRIIEQAHDYDLNGYMKDDLLIEDPEFFHKIQWLVKSSGGTYTFVPHRCEQIPGRGDVILSGDPDGRRNDLPWDTGETLKMKWPLGERRFYRAKNPHSGCYFLTRDQALRIGEFWRSQRWWIDFQFGGVLENACVGLLLPVLKMMKPVPEHYRFLMVRHQDHLWTRHHFEHSFG